MEAIKKTETETPPTGEVVAVRKMDRNCTTGTIRATMLILDGVLSQIYSMEWGQPMTPLMNKQLDLASEMIMAAKAGDVEDVAKSDKIVELKKSITELEEAAGIKKEPASGNDAWPADLNSRSFLEKSDKTAKAAKAEEKPNWGRDGERVIETETV